MGATYTDNIAIPFPLSDGSLVTLYAPTTMQISDARRLKRAINALYINGRDPADKDTSK